MAPAQANLQRVSSVYHSSIPKYCRQCSSFQGGKPLGIPTVSASQDFIEQSIMQRQRSHKVSITADLPMAGVSLDTLTDSHPKNP